MATTLVCPACSASMVVAVIQPAVRVRCPTCRHVFVPPSPWLPPGPAPSPFLAPPVCPAPPPVEILSLDDEPARTHAVRGTPKLPPPPPRVDDEPTARSNSPVLIGGVAALLLVVVGVGVWLATRDRKPAETDTTAVEPTTTATPNPTKDAPKKETTTSTLPADESKDLAIIDTLQQVVRSGETGDRMAAARRLGALGPNGGSAIPTLLSVADPKSPAVEAAIGKALAKIGPPRTGLDNTLVKALESRSAVAREYAVQCLANGTTVPEDGVPALIGVLSDTSPVVRAGGAKALGVAGAKAKSALAPLLDLAADTDDAVRAAAVAALAKLGPLEDDDRAVVEKKLAHTNANVRLAAAGALAPLVTTAEDAEKTWPPLLKDADPDVRVFALGQVVKHPAVLEKSGEAVVMLLADPMPAARLTAVNLAPKFKGFAGLEAGIEKLLATETDEGVKTAAMVAAVTIADANALRLGLFRKVLTTGSAPAKRAAADKLATLKDGASPAVDELIACMANVDEEVRAAAIRALAAVGKDGLRARDAIAITFATDKSDAVVVAAADYLAATEGGFQILKAARDRTLPPGVAAAMCRAFAPTADKDTLKWMTEKAVEVEGCREVVTAALVKLGKDEHVVALIEHTYRTKAGKPGQPPTPLAVEARQWALATITKMDYANLCTAATKVRLADRVKDLSMSIGANEKELAADAAAFLKVMKP